MTPEVFGATPRPGATDASGTTGAMPDPATVPRPWLASYPPGVPHTYGYPPVALPRLLDDAARDLPATTAVSFAGTSLSYATLDDLVARFAAELVQLGVGLRTVVAVALPNLPASPIAMFATWRAGGVVVPLDAALPAKVLADRLAETGAVLLVTTGAVAAGLDAARLADLRHVVVTGRNDWLRRRRRRRRRLHAARDGQVAMTDLLATAPPTNRQPRVGPDDLAVIHYTAGTGHRSRARPVRLTHGNLVANSFQARLWVPDMQAGKERLLAALPFTHPYGLTLGLLTGVLAAATLVLLDRFEPGEALATIAARRPTLLPATPEMCRALVAAAGRGRHDLGSLRACVSGGAPLPLDVARRFEDLTGGGRVREGYGCAEAAPLTHANPIYGRGHLGTIGLPVTDTVAIVVAPDDPGRLLAPGEVGELAVRGPQVTHGYWQGAGVQPGTVDHTGRRVLREGWLLTGDLARQGPEGEFVLATPVGADVAGVPPPAGQDLA